MSRIATMLMLPFVFLACASAPDDAAVESLSSEVSVASTYVRITGTCFQSYEMTAVNTGATLGASKLVFKAGEEDKQFAFCAGTDRVILRGSKTVDGSFAVDNVWMQQSGNTVSQDTEIVRAIRLDSSETFEVAANARDVRRVTLQFGAQTLSEQGNAQLAAGRILLAGPRQTAAAGGYGQSASNARRVDAVFEELN